MGLLEMAQKY